jgi:hypothetical protein
MKIGSQQFIIEKESILLKVMRFREQSWHAEVQIMIIAIKLKLLII